MKTMTALNPATVRVLARYLVDKGRPLAATLLREGNLDGARLALIDNIQHFERELKQAQRMRRLFEGEPVQEAWLRIAEELDRRSPQLASDGQADLAERCREAAEDLRGGDPKSAMEVLRLLDPAEDLIAQLQER